MFSGIFNRRILIPAIIGAGICVLFLRSGFLVFIFLVPLGFLARRFDYRVVWISAILAVLLNMIIIAGSSTGVSFRLGILDIAFFSSLVFIFSWITAPPPFLRFNIPGSGRMVVGSSLGALLFIGIFFHLMANPDFLDQITYLTSLLLPVYSSSGAEVSGNMLVDRVSMEAILDIMISVMLRGGSLFTCVFILFVSRHFGFFLARLTLREKRKPVFLTFHVLPVVIWVLSGSLILLVFTSVTGLRTPEILLWNILLLCAMMYLAQGLGIIQFFLARPSTPPFLKLLFIFVFLVLIFNPVLYSVLLAGIVLLGIAENWIPFRVSKIPGAPPTPEAGERNQG